MIDNPKTSYIDLYEKTLPSRPIKFMIKKFEP